MSILSDSTSEPRSPITDAHFTAFVKTGDFWTKLSPEQRSEILNAPALHQEAYLHRTKLLDIEPTEPIQRILKAHRVKPNSQQHLHLIRLIQVCHEISPVHGSDPPSAKDLASRLVECVLSKEMAEAYAKEKIRSHFWFDSPPPKLDARYLGTTGRLRRFLDIPEDGNGLEWEKHSIRHHDKRNLSMLSGKHVTKFACELLELLVDHGLPLPLAKLLEWCEFDPNKQSALIGKALRALSQHMLVVIDYDLEAEGLRIGLWPGMPRKLQSGNNAAPLPAATSEPVETFTAPLLANDLAIIIAEAVAAPIKLKANRSGDMYAADARRIAKHLEPVPAWADQEGRFSSVNRPKIAASFALLTDHLEYTAAGIIKATAAGIDFLKAGPREQQKRVIEALRRRGMERGYAVQWDFVANYGEFRTDRDSEHFVNAAQAMVDAWAQIPDNTWVEINTCIEHILEQHNPVERTVGQGRVCYHFVPSFFGYFTLQAIYGEDIGDHARPWVERFLHSRLFPLGGVEIGRTTDNKQLIRITPIGRYILDKTSTYPEIESAAAGRVILQPNYEIVFLGPNLLARATLAPFCEDIAPGKTTGILYRITKSSVQRHLHEAKPENGAESILTALRETCGDALPANVQSEIQSWAAARREYTQRDVIAIGLPDRTTTLLAHGILKNSSTLVNDTTLLLDRPPTTAEKKKLEKVGIFPGSDATPAAPQPQKKNKKRARQPRILEWDDGIDDPDDLDDFDDF